MYNAPKTLTSASTFNSTFNSSLNMEIIPKLKPVRTGKSTRHLYRAFGALA
jgi:hypothetical protein